MAYRLRLKEVLKEKNVSQGQLSRGADIALNTVRKMVNEPNYKQALSLLSRPLNKARRQA